MVIEKKKTYLSTRDANILRRYCIGCRFFIPDKPVVDICTLVGWYKIDNIQEVVGYVKKCPCNQKCIVKASCMDETCPIWMEYLNEAVEYRQCKKLGLENESTM